MKALFRFDHITDYKVTRGKKRAKIPRTQHVTTSMDPLLGEENSVKIHSDVTKYKQVKK